MRVGVSHRVRAVFLGLVVAGFASPALAVTTPVSGASVGQHNPTLSLLPGPYIIDSREVNSSPPSAAAASQYNSGDWGYSGATSEASLATGQLHGRVYSSLTGAGVYEYNNIYQQTNAFFGDGFRTYAAGGSPFVWTTGTTAKFGITVEGTSSSSRSLAALNAGVWVTLLMYQPNTLDPGHIFGSPPNFMGYYHYLIGNPNLDVYSFGVAGDGFFQLLPTAYLGPLNNGPITINQDIAPGGDFDWVILFGALGNARNPGETFDIDLSHTVTFSYEGPAGTTTETTSGDFQNFDVPRPTAIPEPSSIALLGAGLAGLGALRRRKKAKA